MRFRGHAFALRIPTRVHLAAPARAAVCLAIVGLVASPAAAGPAPPPADSLVMSAGRCIVWTAGRDSIVELEPDAAASPAAGNTAAAPVQLRLDRTTLSADRAVVWLRSASPPDTPGADRYLVSIALVGHARLQQGSVTRFDRNLLVTATITGSIRLIGQRIAENDDTSDLYRTALALHRQRRGPGTAAATQPAAEPAAPATTASATTAPSRPWWESQPPPHATTRPATTAPFSSTALESAPLASAPQTIAPSKRFIDFNMPSETTERDEHGDIAAVLSGGIILRYGDAKGDLLEFTADRVVLFTDLKALKGAGEGEDFRRFLGEHVRSLYCEGDVRVYSTSADPARPELRMAANRVYYDLTTDRAVMTDVVFHTIDAQKQIPIFMRARIMRLLSQSEFEAEGLQLTTSGFATPTYSLGASQAYVHAEPTGDPTLGDRISFNARDALFQVEGVPLFYLPETGGTMTSRGGALQDIAIVDSSEFGKGFHSRWGLFESLGKVPPKDAEVSYTVDYMSARGPAVGTDARYTGGVVDETTKEPFSFTGDLHAYFVHDKGIDTLGGIRPDVHPDTEYRGRAYLEHQDFFPDDWQTQIRLGWVSDANFQTQWFPLEFYTSNPIDESIEVKHQHDDETFSLLGQWQPNALVTTSDFVPSQREVDHLPQISYDLEGQSLLDDRLSFYSENSFTDLDFVKSRQGKRAQGFLPGLGLGLSSIAYTGDPGDFTDRGDFRQELNLPIDARWLKIVPYIFGRYTVYSQGVLPEGNPLHNDQKLVPGRTFVDDNPQNRLMAGGGVRLSTEFWKVDDSAESMLFDIHRLRHVIEPEVNLFVSSQNVDQNRIFIYDPEVDAINDIRAVQFALRQKWQTKRGGPGKWRSVDFLTWDVYADLYGNQPAAKFRDPTDFRGLFYETEPEFSQARNSVNSDATWRISDTTAILADMSHNLDAQKFATGGIGVAVQRSDELGYYLGLRYVDDLDSLFANADVNYELTRKYTVGLNASVDLTQSRGIMYTGIVTRKFDRFSVTGKLYYDQIANDSGFDITFTPYGFGRGIGSDQANQP